MNFTGERFTFEFAFVFGKVDIVNQTLLLVVQKEALFFAHFHKTQIFDWQ
jgi:hypothetical protein